MYYLGLACSSASLPSWTFKLVVVKPVAQWSGQPACFSGLISSITLTCVLFISLTWWSSGFKYLSLRLGQVLVVGVCVVPVVFLLLPVLYLLDFLCSCLFKVKLCVFWMF